MATSRRDHRKDEESVVEVVFLRCSVKEKSNTHLIPQLSAEEIQRKVGVVDSEGLMWCEQREGWRKGQCFPLDKRKEKKTHHFDLRSDSFDTGQSESNDRNERNHREPHQLNENERKGEEEERRALLEVDSVNRRDAGRCQPFAGREAVDETVK
jgi:hypothetical protein